MAEPISGRAIAIAGIARPRSFFDAARDAGFEIVQESAFRDHHRFSRREVERVRDAAARLGAGVILTTEKDAMRLEAHTADLGGARWMYLPMELVIEPAADFASWLKARL
jgi:tetraacyldisaccharide-1-P 4'-kinase